MFTKVLTKPLPLILISLLVLLQYKLWLAPGGVAETWQLNKSILQLNNENQQAAAKNAALLADVKDLKEGNEAIEERARTELGMIKQGETFYQIVQ